VSVILRGTGSCLPRRVVPNTFFQGVVESPDEWIRSRTGIAERRFAEPTDTSATLAVAAARNALSSSGLSAADIDLILCATVTPDMMTPANACQIQSALGCRAVPAFDVVAACSGFLYAIAIGHQFISGGLAKNVLVVGTEVLSRVLNFNDRNSCVLFGDGAGAVVIAGAGGNLEGVTPLTLGADGTRGDLILVPSQVTSKGSPWPSTELIAMQGREVYKLAVQRLAALVREAVERCHSLGKEIDLLIPHQVNLRIIEAVLDAAGFPADRAYTNLDRFGNTASASIPLALDEAIRSGRAQPGQTILSVAFGGGLTWASVLFTL
jgi:3-oxoacyl-[acyl-carrier-protein] synthase III